jgi:glucose-6-phosphate isomerase
MIDLRATSGLPLEVDDSQPDLALVIGGRLRPGVREERTLADLRPALADPEADGPDPAYYMYRGVGRFSAADGDSRRVYNWRYDVTVFPSGRYGDEYLRTVGHYHPARAGATVAYPEVYEVLHGTALFVLQKVDTYQAGPADVRVADLILLRAEAGEKAMMLPDYGHWTVNTTDQPLIVSNWICDDFSSHYCSVIAARGPCCYVVAGGSGSQLRRNPAYNDPPAQISHARTVGVRELGLVTGRPMFAELPCQPSRWRYLCHPDEAATDLPAAIRITHAEPFPR